MVAYTWSSTFMIIQALKYRFYFGHEDNKESGYRVFVKERKGSDDQPIDQVN